MRNHGWELPYHPLQTVAVAVFSGLSFSFYVFFIPFVGSSVMKFHVYAAFSPVVLAVFILYVRCAGCDPADPGVHQSKLAAKAKHRAALMPTKLSQSNVETCLEHSHDDSETNSSPYKTLKIEDSGLKVCARWLCLPFACCKRDDPAKLNMGEQLLYCSICEAEISKNSKHCRACDKCVYEFDHHCRWLNNCVGRRNYRAFVSLMVACLLLLVIVWTTGIGVLVRCFAQKTSFDKEIIRRLGSSFSRVSYIIVVALLSVLAMFGTIPLGQLFFFHLILIHKGITTYDYILAVREQGIEQEIAEGDGFNSLTSSPASSNATGISGYRSGGALALHKGVFCTPPRMFVEHQQGLIQSLNKSNLDTSVVTPNEKVAVWEDGIQGKFKPRTSSASRSYGSRGSRSSGRDSTGEHVNTGSSGSRAEANILKHVRKEWPELRDRLSLSPEDSGAYFTSPFDCHRLDCLEPKQPRAINVCTSASKDASLMPDELVPTTKRLKDSLIMGKNSTKHGGALSVPTAWEARDC